MRQYAFAIPLRFGSARLCEVTANGLAESGPEESPEREANGLQDEQGSSASSRKNGVSMRGARARK
jgi:hypothetical protein